MLLCEGEPCLIDGTDFVITVFITSKLLLEAAKVYLHM